MTYDRFVAGFRAPVIEPVEVTFALGADGKVDRSSMRAVIPTADLSFEGHNLRLIPVEDP